MPTPPSCALRHARRALPALFALGLAASVAPERARAEDAGAPAAAEAAADTVDLAGLGPASAPPWLPPRPVPAAETWETVLRLPGRVASLPLSGAGALARAGLLSVQQNFVVPKTLYALSILPRRGVFLAPASLGDRTGFGGALRVQPPALRRAAYVEWSGSTRGYARTLAGLGAPFAGLEYAEEWRPQEPFHGAGLQSPRAPFAHYAWKRQAVRFEARAALGADRRARRRPWLAGAAWAGPEHRVLRRGRGVEDPAGAGFDADDAGPLEALFPDAAAGLDRPRESFVWGARLVTDRRAGRPHWSRGFRFAAEAERHAGPHRALALRDARAGTPRYWRFVYAAETGVSFGRDPRTLRLAARVVDTELSAGSPPPDPFDLAHLGGRAGLDGFEPHRFADLDALTARAAWIFPLIQQFEMELHAEAGGVWTDLQHEARLDRLKGSYGVMLRPRTRLAPLGEFGVTWSAEGVRARFGFGGVE
uniref:Bacterial surface antigen (D15) domain-containing protein n=1 Tax=Eiseniibacteriota bacterium TaxID=2212470 RepID=A0A832I0G1_UNCEI